MKKTTKRSPKAPVQNALLTAMQTNNTVTAKGAVSHSTSGTSVLDLFAKGGSMRSETDVEIRSLFSAAYAENKTLALKVLFYLRDVREGQGERKLFRVCYNWLAQNDSAVAKKLLELVPEYARFDDILESLENTVLEQDALKFMAKQLKADTKSDTPTLAAKWAPSEQASSQTTKRLAAKLRKQMRMSPKAYRKMLSKLRADIDIVERRMCSGDWTGIDYQAVPSRASTLYRGAFKKHDEAGYTKFIGNVQKGVQKINASVLYPYDIVREIRGKCISGYNYGSYTAKVTPDATLEAQWKALPDYLKDFPYNGLVIADVSGSMDSAGYHKGGRGVNNVAPIDVAVSLAIYFAERNKGAFQNNFMIFSSEAKLLTLKGSNLAEKVANVMGSRPACNTNLQAAFDLILDKAKKHKVPQEDMPTTLFIISDGQFDPTYDNTCTNLELARKKFQAAGYELPRLVSWNVNAHDDVAAKANDKGIVLVSGCSPSTFKSALNGKVVTPWETMLATVEVPRYEPISA